MFFADLLTLDAPRRTSEGFLVTRARSSRTGVYKYTGREVDPNNEHGLRDQAVVNVLRDGETVFDKKAAHSFIGKPITDEHPSVPVDSTNWRDHARGVVMGALKDGEHLAFDILLTDATAIAAVDAGKRELSNGYAADLEFGEFTADDGTACQVRQASIRGNHVAIVDKGRAGSTCAIADAARCVSLPADVFELLTDERTYSDGTDPHKNEPARRETSTFEEGSHVATKTITFDGLPVEVTDAAEAVIRKLEGQLTKLTADKAAVDTKVGELTAQVSTKDGEIAALNQKVKDAEIGPDKLQQLVADRSALVDQAKAIDPNVVTDGKTDAEIRKAVVSAKLGDAAKDMDDATVAGAFKAFAKDAPIDPVRKALLDGVRSNINDNGASVRDLARAAQF